MSTPSELYREGKLQAAIEALGREIKAHPNDPERRTFLFELLCFAGDLDRAERQLQVIGQQHAQSEWAVQVYQNILAAERTRRAVMSQGGRPEFLLDPPPYVELHLQAIRHLHQGEAAAARQRLDEAERLRPALSGRWRQEAVDDFRDCDDLAAPVLEFMMLRDYIWIPWEHVRTLQVARPERPRDLLWAPVRLVLSDGNQRRGYLPTLYPGTDQQPDERLQLGRMTDWSEDAGGIVRGIGLRLLLAGQQAIPILELDDLELAAQPS